MVGIMNAPSTCLENMPPEVLIYNLLPYFNPFDLCRLMWVNRKFKDVVYAFVKHKKNINMQEVTRICADDTEKIIAAFEFMTRGNTSLVRINLKNCSWIKESQLMMILESNKKLVEVNLSNVKIMPSILKCLVKLRKLRIVKIGDVGSIFETSSAMKIWLERVIIIISWNRKFKEKIESIKKKLDTLQKQAHFDVEETKKQWDKLVVPTVKDVLDACSSRENLEEIFKKWDL